MGKLPKGPLFDTFVQGPVWPLLKGFLQDEITRKTEKLVSIQPDNLIAITQQQEGIRTYKHIINLVESLATNSKED